MLKLLLLTLVAFTSVAWGDVDERFAEGSLGLKWGTSLEQVQAMWPGGMTWPVEGKTVEAVVYVIAPDLRVLDGSTPVKQVQFVFTNKNELQAIAFHFNYVDRDSALYDLGEMLGHDYAADEDDTGRKYGWASKKEIRAAYRVGKSAQQPWAFFAVQSKKVQ